MNVPIIRLEVERMKHTLCVALSEYAAQMDATIQQAVEEFCTDGNLEHILKTEAKRQIEMAVKEEVGKFFGWSGAGRRAVKEAVIQRLNERYPTDEETP